jgi:hypothetical protein
MTTSRAHVVVASVGNLLQTQRDSAARFAENVRRLEPRVFAPFGRISEELIPAPPVAVALAH